MKNDLHTSLNERTLAISSPGAEPLGELRIFSDRNNRIARASDSSARDPHPEARSLRPFNRNTAYPIVDIVLTPGMYGVLCADHVLDGSYTVNPMYTSAPATPVAPRMEIPGHLLEPWENWFCYNDPGLLPTQFWVAIPVGRHTSTVEVQILSDSWSGRVELWREGDDRTMEMVSRSLIAPRESTVREVPTKDPHTCSDTSPAAIGRKNLLSALRLCAGYLLRSQERSPESGATGSAYLLYDYDGKTFRQKNWFWTLGPAIRALLDLSKIPELGDMHEEAASAALLMGHATTRRIQTNEAHPAFGIPVTRFDTDREGRDYEAKYSPSDALFLAGWGWLPLYQATGDAHFLRATRQLVRASERLIKREAVIVQDYYERHGAWNDWTMNEAGFGMEGLADLYLETNESWVFDTGKRYIEQLTGLLESDDGLWHRHFFRHDRMVNPTDGATRGLGWAMEGLTAAYRMGLGDRYLEKATTMAEHLLAHQREDGCWGVIFTDPPGSDAGADDKGTPLWSVLFYRMYKLTRDKRYLSAAQRALGWSISKLYDEGDPDGLGGIPTTAPNGGIIYWPRYRLSCLYAVGFAAIAMEEELLRPSKVSHD